MDILEQIRKIDKSDMLNLLTTFPEQFENAVEIGNSFKYQIDSTKIKQIVFVGMGGSAIGGDLIISCLSNDLKIPAFVNRNYFLPTFVDNSTLIIVSSFSGNTEESLSCYEDARTRSAEILCITSGGELAQKAEKDGTPFISIPGGMQPRAALGYLSIPVLITLINSGFASQENVNFDETYELLKQKARLYAPQKTENQAITLAQKITKKIPIMYSTNNMLQIVANRWKCQISENAKTLAFFNVFPELNHNEIVGWEQLPDLLDNFQILYLCDKEDFSRNQSRMSITKDILKKVTNSVIELHTEGVSRLARLFSLIYLGDMVSFYLAILNNVDPTPIEKIQLLKDQLKNITQ